MFKLLYRLQNEMLIHLKQKLIYKNFNFTGVDGYKKHKFYNFLHFRYKESLYFKAQNYLNKYSFRL